MADNLEFVSEYEYRERPITFKRLMDMMEAGAEPVNNGDGWQVDEFDRLGIRHVRFVEDAVVNQVRAFGNTETLRETRGMRLRLRHGAENRII